MSEFQKGDRVRLTDRFVKVMGYKGRKLPIDWSKREGVVLAANALRVRVLWDGTKQGQTTLPKALEKIECHASA